MTKKIFIPSAILVVLITEGFALANQPSKQTKSTVPVKAETSLPKEFPAITITPGPAPVQPNQSITDTPSGSTPSPVPSPASSPEPSPAPASQPPPSNAPETSPSQPAFTITPGTP